MYIARRACMILGFHGVITYPTMKNNLKSTTVATNLGKKFSRNECRCTLTRYINWLRVDYVANMSTKATVM